MSQNSAKRTKPIPGGQNEQEYRAVMRKITAGLTKENLDTLLFLCKDHIPRGREISSCLDLVKFLEDRDLISHYSAVFIAEALHIIRRMDLLKVIPCIRNKKHFEDEFLAFTYSSFSPYRVLTVQLQDELSQRDFESFRHECSQHLNIRSVDSSKNVLALLWKLEEEDVISGDEFDNLLSILQNIDNVKPLKMFQRLLNGDEGVVLPAGKQQQRQNSEQDMFPDRHSSPPMSEPPSYNHTIGRETIGRVEAMPFMQAPPLGPRASLSPGYEYEGTVNTKKYYQSPEPAMYNFDNPDGGIKVSDSRWFANDEVTPKAVGAAMTYPETHRTDSPASMPPNYPHNYYPNPHHSQSYDGLSSLSWQQPGPYPPQRHESQSLHVSATYPEIPQMPVHHQDYYGKSFFPPQPYEDPVYHHTNPQSYPVHRQYQVQNHYHRPDVKTVSAELEGLSMSSTESKAKEDALDEKVSHDSSAIPQTAVNQEQESQLESQRREELKAQILEEQRNRGSYKMDSSPVGLCVLINNVKFIENRKTAEYERRKKLNSENVGTEVKKVLPNIHLDDREGSDCDADKLEMLFERLDFTVERHNDLDQRSMMKVLKEASEIDHTKYDCFLLIILSHGDNGCVFGVDGFRVKLCDLQKMFWAEKCVTLADKPKIFIIQACQGAKSMPAYAPEADLITHDGPVIDDITDKGTPNKSDFLMAHSTVPGYISYRSIREGSYYVQEIVRIFKSCHQTEDLLSMMVMVSDAVGKYQRKQVPMPIPTLRKKVYFHLKAGCTLDDLDDSSVTEYPSMEVPRQTRVTQESGDME